MAPRIARNNRDSTAWVGDDIVPDWNGQSIGPGDVVVVDDEANIVLAAVEAGVLELDPTLGRHYTAGPTERPVRPVP